MAALIFVLLLASFLCFVLAAAQAPFPRVNLLALGLAFWVLTALIEVLPRLAVH